MGLRQSILFVGGCAALVGLLYVLWYRFGPESAAPDYQTMKKYVMSRLTDEQLKEMVEAARKNRANAIADDQEMRKNFWKDYGDRVRAWEVDSAKCKTDEIFKLRNADLCSGPPGAGLAGMAMAPPDGRVESEEQYIEWEIMFRCELVAPTIREARRNGCLPPE